MSAIADLLKFKKLVATTAPSQLIKWNTIGTQASVVGVVGSQTQTILIPANTVSGLNAAVEVFCEFTATNDAMTKAATIAIAGQTVGSFSTTTGSRNGIYRLLGINRNALNSQVWPPLGVNGGGFGTGAQVGTLATNIDWTVDNNLVVTISLSGAVVAGSTVTSEYVHFRVLN
jgi:hypothetical protein